MSDPTERMLREIAKNVYLLGIKEMTLHGSLAHIRAVVPVVASTVAGPGEPYLEMAGVKIYLHEENPSI